MITLSNDQIIAHKLRAHHLEAPLPISELLPAAGACGLQNSPPGVWETALFNRISDISITDLYDILYEKKLLLQAFSFRGAPYLFPTSEREVFLNSLISEPGEPWIYTNGIGLVLEHMDMTEEELLQLLLSVIPALDTMVVQSKATLDLTLANLITPLLSAQKKELWNQPSMFGTGHIVGEAAVSFLLRPCAFMQLVVFAKRQSSSPEFTSLLNWAKIRPVSTTTGKSASLVHKFLHCYAPANIDMFSRFLGSSRLQAERLWNMAAASTLEIQTEDGHTRSILRQDLESFQTPISTSPPLMLLSPHDPYLDLGDHSLILADKERQKQVWKTVANPGVIIKNGRIIGIWTMKKTGNSFALTAKLWQPVSVQEEEEIGKWVKRYAAFRGLKLTKLSLDKTLDHNCN